MVPLRFGFTALISGQDSRAKELAMQCNEAFTAAPQKPGDVRKALRKGIGEHKRTIADAHIQAKLGISYGEFKKSGKTWIPDDVFRDLLWEIRAQLTGDELIVSGFIKATPYIFKVSDDKVIACHDFAVIGSGTALGEASLFQRSQNLSDGLYKTIYQVYEAKRLAERAEGVGEKTQLMVVWHNGRMQAINDTGIMILKSAFVKLSPQPVKDTLILPKEAFDTVLFE
jgi:hypothetical protein